MSFTEKIDAQVSANFDEVNLKSLTEGEIPAQAYRMFEGNYGTGEKVEISYEAMKKTVKSLLD